MKSLLKIIMLFLLKNYKMIFTIITFVKILINKTMIRSYVIKRILILYFHNLAKLI